jgi:hypothetical protein
MPDTIGSMDSNYVIARVVRREKDLFTKASKRLGVSVSDMIVSAMRVVSGEVLSGRWECRKVHISGNRILAIGEEPPVLTGGVPVPVVSCKIVAPRMFWRTIERSVGED